MPHLTALILSLALEMKILEKLFFAFFFFFLIAGALVSANNL